MLAGWLELYLQYNLSNYIAVTHSMQEACSLQYYFLILWRILGVLPPSKAYVEQLKTGNSDPSESDILHTLRWSSRLGVSTYVNWIKVRF